MCHKGLIFLIHKAILRFQGQNDHKSDRKMGQSHEQIIHKKDTKMTLNM